MITNIIKIMMITMTMLMIIMKMTIMIMSEALHHGMVGKKE